MKTYSGGMRRRLDLAGALVAEPPVLFLDEPTTGLDPRSRTDLWTLIRELVAAGSTLLLTTQYLEEADQLADEIVVIDHGRAIAQGTSDQLKKQVGGERIEVVTSERDLDRAAELLRAHASGEVTVERHVQRVQAPTADGPGALRRALDDLDAAGIVIHDVGLRRPTLEDVFLTLTGHGTDDVARLTSHRRADQEVTSAMSTLTAAVADTAVIAKRNVIKIRRVPEVLVFVLLSPIMFVLLFAYVFGGSIDVPGSSYREFLIAGIFAQTVLFGATFTGAGLAEDMQKGIINRFRSLPMSQSAVLVGRTASDVIYNILSIAIMSITGLLVGWRIRGSALEAIAGFALLLVFAYAISWVMAYIGLLVPSVEVINQATFMVLFPLTFIANTFVPADSLPPVLQTFAEWNPVSAVTQACRELFGNIPPDVPPPTVWPLANPVLYTMLWVVGIIAVFAPLSVRQYRRATLR